MNKNIAIDGPAGAGKSTVAKIISERKKYIYINTGSLYRAIAYYMVQNNVDYNNIEEVKFNLNNINIELKYVNNADIIILNGNDITSYLRTDKISEVASVVAIIPEVREKLVSLQRNIAKKHDVIMEGRDITSVVLPDANYKIYLDAELEERAKRRFCEYKEKGLDKTLEQVIDEINLRDQRDMTRKASPLIKVRDAIYINSTNLNIEDVVSEILNLIK